MNSIHYPKLWQILIMSTVLALVIVQPAMATMLGTVEDSVDVSGQAAAIVVVDDYAYVADGSAGLQIIDISNPTAPEKVGTYNTLNKAKANGIAVFNSYAFIAAGKGVVIVDVSVPSSPQYVHTVNTNNAYAYAQDIVLSPDGHYAYVAMDMAGLMIVDISDPTTTTIMAEYDLSDTSIDLAVQDNYVYIASDFGGVNIIDVTNPATPQLVAQYNLSESLDPAALAVAVKGSWLYSAFSTDPGDGSAVFYLKIINISNPTSPKAVGTIMTAGGVDDIAVQSTYAYLADGTTGVEIVNVARPRFPKLVAQVNTTGYALGVALANDTIYVADHVGGITLIDASTPASPMFMAQTYTSGMGKRSLIHNNYAYIADGAAGLQIVDVSDQAALRHVSTFATEYAQDVAVTDSYAYIADGSAGLVIVDISDPSAVQPVVHWHEEWVDQVESVDATYIVAAYYSQGITIIDVTNPAAPNIVAEIDVADSIFDIVVIEHIAYISTSQHILLYDLTVPTTPVLLGQYQTGTYDSAMTRIAVFGDYLYGVGGDDLFILSMVDPARPIKVGQYTAAAGETMTALSIQAGYAFITATDSGIEVVNVTDPTNPVWSATVTDPLLNDGSAINALSNDTVFVTSNQLHAVMFYNDFEPPTPPETEPETDDCSYVTSRWYTKQSCPI